MYLLSREAPLLRIVLEHLWAPDRALLAMLKLQVTLCE
jgi:hypothetical protein